MKLKRLAVAWLLEKDWPAWLKLDHGFQPDHGYWLRRMTTTCARLEAAGINTVKVTLTPAEFIAWLDSDAGAQYRALLPTHQRAGYAAMKAMAMDSH